MNNINISFKKIYSLLILTFLFCLILINTTHSEEKVGSIVSLNNEVYAVNADGEKRLLDLYDEILLQDEILTNELSTATVQYNDNSTIIIKKSSSFKVTDFNITGLKDIFLGEVQKGSVIIESGKIAKKDNGSMIIKLPTMTLDIKGTRFNIVNKIDGSSEVSLAEDSFGNVGIINVSSEGEVKTLYDTEQVVSVNLETGISERPKTEDEKKELIEVSNDLIEASSIDENLIQEKLEEKLINGSLLDANGDGVIDASDIEVIKEGIKLEKQKNINFIVENSTGENTEFLSNVLNISDEASIGESMNQILETNDYLVASVITNLSNEDNTFLTTSNVEANNAIKEKIFTQMLSYTDDENNNIAVIGSIFAKSDAESVGLMMDTIQTVGETNADSTLALEVFSSMADSESFYDMDFRDEEYFGDEAQEQYDQMMEIQEQYDRMMEQAVFSAADSEDGAMMLANMMTHGNEESIYMMMDTIGMMAETNADSTLALEVFSSMADSESFDDMDFGDEGQEQYDQMMEQAVFSAADSEDGAMMLANMMTHGNEESIYMMMDTIGMMAETNADSTLALEVFSSMADSESFYDMDFGDEGQEQYDQMMEQAVFSAADSEDGAMMLANMMTYGSEESIYMMMDTIGMMAETNADSTLALEVFSSMADSGESFDDMDFGDEGQEQYDRMMEQAVFSAANSEDGAMMLANVMTEADADTVGIMFDYISNMSKNDEYSTLGAEVLSSVAGTSAMDSAYFDTETMDQFYDFINTTTYTTTAVDDGFADDMYDASGFSFMPPYFHRNGTLYNNDGFDVYGNSLDDDGVADDMYDAGGFSFMPPYFHRNGTLYDNDGYDVYGNSDPGEGGAYDANGFSFMPPYNHINGTLYDDDGYDRYGNYNPGAGGTYGPSWDSFPYDLTFTQNENFSVTDFTATANPYTNDIEYSLSGTAEGAGLYIDSASGELSGSISSVNTYTATITATDTMSYNSISENIDIIITAAAGGYGDPTWDTNPSDQTFTQNESISVTDFTATADPYTNDISYSLSGTAEGAGLYIDSASGELSGSISSVNTYTATITATDTMSYNSISENIDIIITAAAAGDPTWDTTPSNQTFTQNESISVTGFTATADPDTNTISYSLSGTADGAGLDISPTTGELSGSISTINTYTATITATDNMSNNSISENIDITITAAAAGDPTWDTTPSNQTFTQNESISVTGFTATADPDTNTISYSLSGTADGAGLDISPTTGELSGSISTINTYTATITATDNMSNNSISENIDITITAAAAGDPTWDTTPSDLTFTQDQSSSATFTATADPPTNTISYSLSGSAYGAGLSIDSSGQLTGDFDTVNTYTATITATDMTSNNFISESISITVYDAAGPTGRDYQGYNRSGYDENGFNEAGNWNATYDYIDDTSAS